MSSKTHAFEDKLAETYNYFCLRIANHYHVEVLSIIQRTVCSLMAATGTVRACFALLFVSDLFREPVTGTCYSPIKNTIITTTTNNNNNNNDNNNNNKWT